MIKHRDKNYRCSRVTWYVLGLLLVLLLLCVCPAIYNISLYVGSLAEMVSQKRDAADIQQIFESLEDQNNFNKLDTNLLAIHMKEMYKMFYLTDTTTPQWTLKDKLEAAQQINNDVIGYIVCNELNIDHPIVYSMTDNVKYLRENIYGQDDVNGTIYLDSRCSPVNSLIYMIHGHNMKDGQQFAALPLLMERETLDGLELLTLIDGDGERKYKIVSVFSLYSKDFAVPLDGLMTFNDVKSVKSDYLVRSMVKCSDVPDNYDIILLNTCWYGKSGQEHNLHCIVMGVRV